MNLKTLLGGTTKVVAGLSLLATLYGTTPQEVHGQQRTQRIANYELAMSDDDTAWVVDYVIDRWKADLRYCALVDADSRAAFKSGGRTRFHYGLQDGHFYIVMNGETIRTGIQARDYDFQIQLGKRESPLDVVRSTTLLGGGQLIRAPVHFEARVPGIESNATTKKLLNSVNKVIFPHNKRGNAYATFFCGGNTLRN